MVDTSLNKKYSAKDARNNDFSPIPEGTKVIARVKEVGDWKPTTKTIKVIQKDENGNALLDEKGNKITETVPNCEFYNCDVKMEVVGGDYDGRLVYHNLTTHPNMQFTVPNFMKGIGLEEATASELKEKAVGRLSEIEVTIETYEKTVQNKETGLDEVQERQVNKIKSFKKIENQNPNAEIETEDYGF